MISLLGKECNFILPSWKTPVLKFSVPIRMPEEVIPARVTTLRYTTKFLSDNSLVMAKRAILREINAKSKNNLRFSFRTSTRFHVKIPLSSSHVNHPFGDSSTRPR